jgi:hypothetical protein
MKREDKKLDEHVLCSQPAFCGALPTLAFDHDSPSATMAFSEGKDAHGRPFQKASLTVVHDAEARRLAEHFLVNAGSYVPRYIPPLQDVYRPAEFLMIKPSESKE